MSLIHVIELFEATDISSRHNGKILREKIEPYINVNKPIILDFNGVNLVTQGFMDEFIGVLIRSSGPSIIKNIKFKNCNEAIKGVIKLVVNYSSNMVLAR